MSTLRFGALDPRHRARLAEILGATGVFSESELAVALEVFDETFQAAGSSSYEFLGLFDDVGALAGYACYGATPGTEGTFDLYWIALDPGAQGRGAGTHLLGEVEQRLRAEGGRLLIAETSSRPAYEPTRRFYERRGYHEAARVAEFYAPADDRVIYAKRLSPRGAGTAPAQQPSTN
jgi:ribosomal protein S18 acetylase RimI-like enzyme